MRHPALVVLLLLLPRLAWADPPAPVVAVPPGDDVIVPMKKGDSAPFMGQLFDQATALRWANYLQQYKLRLQTDVDYQKKYDGAELAFQQKQLELERAQYAKVTEELQAKLNTAQTALSAGPPWYKTADVGFVVGVVATVATACTAVAVVNAVK